MDTHVRLLLQYTNLVNEYVSLPRNANSVKEYAPIEKQRDCLIHKIYNLRDELIQSGVAVKPFKWRL